MPGLWSCRRKAFHFSIEYHCSFGCCRHWRKANQPRNLGMEVCKQVLSGGLLFPWGGTEGRGGLCWNSCFSDLLFFSLLLLCMCRLYDNRLRVIFSSLATRGSDNPSFPPLVVKDYWKGLLFISTTLIFIFITPEIWCRCGGQAALHR